MSWFGWLVVLIFAYSVLSNLYEKNRCARHRVLGRCRRCEEEEAARVRSEAEARARAERRRAEIEQAYRNMDEDERKQLVAFVTARAEREHLLIRPGDLEQAVVTLHEKRRRSQTVP